MRASRLLLLVGAALLLQGCYLIGQTKGQLAILWGRESIQERLDDGHALDPDRRRKFELVLAARAFAIKELGLAESDSYTTYYDTAGEPVAWNVSAAPKDSLEPITWSFPIVGTIPSTGGRVISSRPPGAWAAASMPGMSIGAWRSGSRPSNRSASTWTMRCAHVTWTSACPGTTSTS